MAIDLFPTRESQSKAEPSAECTLCHCQGEQRNLIRRLMERPCLMEKWVEHLRVIRVWRLMNELCKLGVESISHSCAMSWKPSLLRFLSWYCRYICDIRVSHSSSHVSVLFEPNTVALVSLCVILCSQVTCPHVPCPEVPSPHLPRCPNLATQKCIMGCWWSRWASESMFALSHVSKLLSPFRLSPSPLFPSCEN